MNILNDKKIAYLFVAPALILMLVLVVLPIVSVVYISLTDWQMGMPDFNFVWFDNYSALSDNTDFQTTLKNSFVYSIGVTLLSCFCGLWIAMKIKSNMHGEQFYSTVLFLPTVASLAAASIAWQMILHPSSGLLNVTLSQIGVVGPNWLRDSQYALPTLMLIGVWERVGFNVIFYLSALHSIPKDYFDAASIEGVKSSFERFKIVIWPAVFYMTGFLIVIGAIHSFQAFESIVILTQGGPQNHTQTLIYSIYQEGFIFFRTNYAAVLTVVLIFVVGSLSLVQFKLSSRKL